MIDPRLRRSGALAALAVCMPFAAIAQDIVLDEITVTAQKREQSALDVPITVDVFGARDIEQTGALNLMEMQDFIPGFEMGANPTQAAITVRGVSSANISTGGDPSVATFYDEVYVPRAATTVTFSDLQRVEVLKGPQGTLYGRNAAAGVVNLVPNRPGPENEAFIKSRVGNLDLFRIEAMGNVALGDNFFVRANVLSNTRGGYVKNLVPGGRDGGEQDNLAARISALWQISDSTDFQVSYDYDKVDNAPRPAIGLSQWSACPTDPRCGVMLNDVVDGKESRDMWAANAKLNIAFSDAWSAKLITGYREFDTINKQDEDGTAEVNRYLDTDNIENSDISYTELQFNFSSDRVNMVFGANYSQENVHQEIPVNTNVDSVMTAVSGEIRAGVVAEVNALIGITDPNDPNWLSEDDALWLLGLQLGLPFTPDFQQIWDPVNMAIFLGTQGINVTPQDVALSGDLFYDALQAGGFPGPFVGPSFAGSLWSEYYYNDGDFKNWGVYGDIDFAVSDRLNLIVGLRYSNDEKMFSWRNPPNSFTASGARGPLPTPDLVFLPIPGYTEARTGTLVAMHDWDKVTGRAVARYQITDNAQMFASYSTGYKSGGYDSLDVSTSEFPLRPEESENIEIGMKGNFFDGTLRAQVAIFDMKIDGRQRTVDTRPPGQPNPIPTIITGDEEFQGIEVVLNWYPADYFRLGLVTTVRDAQATWEEFYNARGEIDGGSGPKSTTDTDYTLTFGWQPTVSRGSLDVRVDYIFNEDTSQLDPNFVEVSEFPDFYEDRRELNARVAWTSDSEQWTAALWGRNLLDQNLLSGIRDISAPFGTPFTSIGAPLTWGVEVGYRF